MDKLFWKIAFFVLLTFNIVTVGVFSYYFFLPDSEIVPERRDNEASAAEVTVQLSKDDVNKLLARSLKEKNFNIYLGEQVELSFEFQVLKQTMSMKFTLNGEVSGTGDLLLKPDNVQIGKMNVPEQYALNFIKRAKFFPDWIEIFPNEETIIVHISQTFSIFNDQPIRLKDFDLANDRIAFAILLENE